MLCRCYEHATWGQQRRAWGQSKRVGCAQCTSAGIKGIYLYFHYNVRLCLHVHNLFPKRIFQRCFWSKLDAKVNLLHSYSFKKMNKKALCINYCRHQLAKWMQSRQQCWQQMSKQQCSTQVSCMSMSSSCMHCNNNSSSWNSKPMRHNCNGSSTCLGSCIHYRIFTINSPPHK